MLGVGIGLAALILTATTNLRGEFQTMRTEIRDIRTDVRDIRVEARADRKNFESHIIRLTEQQGILSAYVESIRGQLATQR